MKWFLQFLSIGSVVLYALLVIIDERIPDSTVENTVVSEAQSQQRRLSVWDSYLPYRSFGEAGAAVRALAFSSEGDAHNGATDIQSDLNSRTFNVEVIGTGAESSSRPAASRSQPWRCEEARLGLVLNVCYWHFADMTPIWSIVRP